jgi:hypothetical protein
VTALALDPDIRVGLFLVVVTIGWIVVSTVMALGLGRAASREMPTPDDELLAEGMDVIRSETPLFDQLAIERFREQLDAMPEDVA